MQFNYDLGVGVGPTNLFTEHRSTGGAETHSGISGFVRLGGDTIAPSGTLTYTLRLQTSSTGLSSWTSAVANLGLMGISD